MFSDKYVRLCKEKGVGVTVASKEIGFSANSGKKWSEGTVPRKTTLLKIAEYFGITVDELLDGEPMPFSQSYGDTPLLEMKNAATSKGDGLTKELSELDDFIQLYLSAPAWVQEQARSLLKAGAQSSGNLPGTDSKDE